MISNVGGDHLGAAIGALRKRGRVVRIGTVGQYNTPDAPLVAFNHADVVEKSVSRTLCVPGVSGLFGRGVAVCGRCPVVRSSG